MSSDVVVIIPARYGSSRFPGKAVALLAGRPLIAHVVTQARAARSVDRVIVATDDARIRDAALAAGAEARLTAATHPSGTDRVAEVARSLACDLVVNVQGDEPLIPPAAIDRCVEALRGDPGAGIATLAHPVAGEIAADPNVVKVVCGEDGRALYFSRALIPHRRDAGADSPRWLRHVGIYGYRRAVLLALAASPPTPHERVERLEQLRALERGIAIRVEVVDWEAHGVDTPADLERVEALLAARADGPVAPGAPAAGG